MAPELDNTLMVLGWEVCNQLKNQRDSKNREMTLGGRSAPQWSLRVKNNT
jgi:hypothetical protein